MAWSGGSTLVVLLVLGVAIYFAAASSLAAAGTEQIRARYAELSLMASGPEPRPGATDQRVTVTNDPSQPGVVIGGALSGTIAIMTDSPNSVPPDGGEFVAAGPPGNVAVDRLGVGGGGLLPDPALVAQAAAAGGAPVVTETSLGSTPVRVLVAEVAGSAADGAPQMMAIVIGDRTAEVDTLRTLLVVLLGGGLAVLAASLVTGYVYAGRALVPIRESLRRQREFAADASHELRTPLAITRAAIAELRRGRADPATVDRALDDLDAGASRLESLVDDLLLLARTDADAVALAIAETDLALAAAEATEAMEPVAGARGVRLVLDIVPAPVRGDEARLRQLATVLLDNAIRHSPPGGHVTVTVRPGARLTVDDDGPGIALEHLEAVFERFWRAPGAPHGGTGLGLAIARWITERHGGSIHAERRSPETGARFVVRVPAG
jgi:signal transduction histidine kinase